MHAREPWLEDLRRGLDSRRAGHLLRALRPADSAAGPEVIIQGNTYIQFSSNNYLGLAADPEVIAAARAAAARWGAGAGSSRLVGGSLAIHHELETALARLKHAPAALVFPTGYMANLAALTTFAGRGDRIVSDKLNHASLLDAAKFSGALCRTFPHRHYARARALLAKPAGTTEHRRDADATRSYAAPDAPSAPAPPVPPRRFLVSDTVFSMDGDVADLPALGQTAAEAGALLFVDDAHGTGILGPSGAGLAELQGVEDRIDLTVGTLSKALGSLGGFITGPQVVIDTLINAARSFIYTTALPPAAAAAALAALHIIARDPARRRRVCALADHVRRELRALGYDTGQSVTPIIPILLGTPERALRAAQLLQDRGLFIPAIRPPTVPPNAARLRVSLMATHTDAHIDRLLEAFRALAPILAVGDCR